MILVNNEHYTGRLDPRQGSESDVENLKQCFTSLNFEVKVVEKFGYQGKKYYLILIFCFFKLFGNEHYIWDFVW